MKIISSLLITLSFCLSLTGCVIKIGGDTDHQTGDITSVLGKIVVGSYKNVGDLSTINGKIIVNDHVLAQDLSTVNGSIKLGDHVQVHSIDVVNGRVTAGTHLKVTQSVTTVNGKIEIDEQGNIGRNVESVNGDIFATQTLIEGNISTVNGDIRLAGKTLVQGNIIYRELHDKHSKNRSKPKLTIAEGVEITGNIVLHQPVDFDFNAERFADKIVYKYSKI